MGLVCALVLAAVVGWRPSTANSHAATAASSGAAPTTGGTRTYYDVLVDGTVAHTSGRVQEAANIYRSVIDAVPSYSDAYHLHGIALLDLGRREEALAYTRRAVELSPNVSCVAGAYAGMHAWCSCLKGAAVGL
jgi:tetratricopeptide (TPR) repeat protein